MGTNIYLNGHNNPITVFDLPQHLLPGASVSCVPTSVGYTGYNGYKVVFFADFHRYPLQIPGAPSFMRTQPLDINMLYNVHVVEVLISNAEICAIKKHR